MIVQYLSNIQPKFTCRVWWLVNQRDA